jgi:hypothetical protein
MPRKRVRFQLWPASFTAASNATAVASVARVRLDLWDVPRKGRSMTQPDSRCSLFGRAQSATLACAFRLLGRDVRRCDESRDRRHQADRGAQATPVVTGRSLRVHHTHRVEPSERREQREKEPAEVGKNRLRSGGGVWVALAREVDLPVPVTLSAHQACGLAKGEAPATARKNPPTGSRSDRRHSHPFAFRSSTETGTVPVRIRIPIPARFKRMIKRAGRGVVTRGGYAGVGRDKACFKNRFHSSRSFTIVP